MTSTSSLPQEISDGENPPKRPRIDGISNIGPNEAQPVEQTYDTPEPASLTSPNVQIASSVHTIGNNASGQTPNGVSDLSQIVQSVTILSLEVTQLREQIKEIPILKTEISTLKTEISKLKTTVDELTKKTEEIPKLRAKVTVLMTGASKMKEIKEQNREK